VGTAAVMATGAFGIVVNWRQVPDLAGRLAAVQADLRESEGSAAKHDELLDSIAETKDRKKAIAQLWHARIPWSRKWAELAQITPGFVGFTEMKLAEARIKGREEENGGLLTLDTLIAGDDLDRLSSFRRVLKGEIAEKGGDPEVGRRFFGAFMDLVDRGAKRVEVKDCVEKVALETPVEMTLKTSDARLAEALKLKQEEERQKRLLERGRAKTNAKVRKPAPEMPVEKTEPADEPAETAPTDASDADKDADAKDDE